eukprot:4922642-Pyramimonas_sp.AAC.1
MPSLIPQTGSYARAATQEAQKGHGDHGAQTHSASDYRITLLCLLEVARRIQDAIAHEGPTICLHTTKYTYVL